jgi:hypothetical protein
MIRWSEGDKIGREGGLEAPIVAVCAFIQPLDRSLITNL